MDPIEIIADLLTVAELAVLASPPEEAEQMKPAIDRAYAFLSAEESLCQEEAERIGAADAATEQHALRTC